MRYTYHLVALCLVTLCLTAVQAEKLYSQGGYHVISTFEVIKAPGQGKWLVKFPKDQGQSGLYGVDSIAVYCGVDKKGYGEDYKSTSRSKLHSQDLKPLWAVLDEAGEYYTCTLDRSSVAGKFRGIFWGRVPATGEWTWHNVDPNLSIVPTDPHGVRIGDYWGYFWDFPDISKEPPADGEDLSFDGW